MASPEPGKKSATITAEGSLLATAINLWGYIWPAGRPDLKWRVVLAVGALLVSKVATTLIPFAYKGIIDGLGKAAQGNEALVMGIAVPVVLVIAYGVGNVVDAGFQQIRDILFASVGQNAVRKLAYRTFEHLRGEEDHRSLENGADNGKEGKGQDAKLDRRHGAFVAQETAALAAQLFHNSEHGLADPRNTSGPSLWAYPNPKVSLSRKKRAPRPGG